MIHTLNLNIVIIDFNPFKFSLLTIYYAENMGETANCRHT